MLYSNEKINAKNKKTIKEEILKLKIEKNALILAHHYQSMEIKEISDFVGDSLELSKIATKVDSNYIVFCGVHFMAESAKILSPEKRVFLPNTDARCPMADMVTKERLETMKAEFPDAKVVAYVNSSAEVKSISDICCTSSNAVNIVKHLEAKEIIFVPDQNLGAYVSKFCPEKTIHLWKGFCPTHHRVIGAEVQNICDRYPSAKLFVHPECRPEVLEMADFIGSTAQIIKACETSEEHSFIIGTEKGVIDTLRAVHPEKEFYMMDDTMVCKNMKKTTLEDVLKSLKESYGEIQVEPEVGARAKSAIFKMIERS
ncbi:quinolinate synthase NadA [Fusibacter bizertensis]